MKRCASHALVAATALLGAVPAALAQQPQAETKKPTVIVPPPAPPGPASYTPGAGGTRPPLRPAAAAPGTPAAAAPAAPVAVFKPAPQMEQLKFFNGKWRCDGKQLATSLFGPEHPITGSAEAKMESDSFWQSFTYQEKKTKVHPGLEVHGMWGWDDFGKRFVRAAADSRGGWDTGTAMGLADGKMAWGGDIAGPLGKIAYRQTFTKKSEKEWTQVLELRGPDGKWATLEEVTCKK